MPPEKQEQTIKRRVQVAVAAAEDDKAVISAARAERHAAKRKRRDEREQALAGKLRALPQKKYGVILADPEWRFEPWSQETGHGSRRRKPLPDIAARSDRRRPCRTIAANDCVLFLWATAPMMPRHWLSWVRGGLTTSHKSCGASCGLARGAVRATGSSVSTNCCWSVFVATSRHQRLVHSGRR